MSPSTSFRHILLVSLFAAVAKVALAAHPRRRPQRSDRSTSSYHYDRSVTTFDPRGRLLQLEYAQMAASRGETLVGIVCEAENCVIVVGSRVYEKLQRIHENCWMVSSGVAGDGLYLAKNLRDAALKYPEAFGEWMSVEEMAKRAGSLQHRLTLVSGYRPLGLVAMLLGTTSNDDEGEPSLYRCAPGGVVQNCRFCTAGAQSDVLMQGLSKQTWREEDNLLDVVEKVLQELRETCGRRERWDVLVIRPGEDVCCYESIGSDRTSINHFKRLSSRENPTRTASL